MSLDNVCVERSKKQRATDHTGKVYNGWRCVRYSHAFNGHSFWDLECAKGCGAAAKKEVASRKRWPMCGCGNQ